MSNLNIPPDEWLKEQFEHHYCDECSGDVEHHTAVPFIGNWFARCDFPRNEKNDSLHPEIAQFHKENDNASIH